MPLQIQDFEYLLAVAEHASIGRASQALGISQPALTKAVHRIETDAGLQLFTRHAKGVLLTEAGRSFLHRGRKIWLEYGDAMREMQQMRTGQLGQLRVGFSPSVSEELVVTAFWQLIQERPAARLQLRERLISELIEMLLAGTLDLILAPASETATTQGLSFQSLYADRFHVVSDRNHPLQGRGTLSLHDLATAQWILPGTHVRVRQWITAEYRKRGLEGPDVRVEAEFGRVSMWPLARNSPLLTLCSVAGLAEARRHGLEVLPAPELEIARDMGVIVRAGAWQSPLAERLTALLRANAGAEQGS